MPMVSCLPAAIAIFSLVPTPSVVATSRGSLIAGGLQVEQRAETAQPGRGAAARRAGGQAA